MSKKGITLLEIIIFMTILVIFSNIVISNVKNPEIRVMNKILTELKNDIRYCQRMSILENKSYEILFRSDMRSYVAGNGKIVILPEGFEIMRIDRNSGRLSSPSIIRFTPLGTLSAGSQTLVISYERRKLSRSMTITLNTGRVLILED